MLRKVRKKCLFRNSHEICCSGICALYSGMLCDQPIQEPVLALLPAKPVLQAIQIATPGLFSLELQADAMFCYAVGHGADHSPTLHDRRNSLGSEPNVPVDVRERGLHRRWFGLRWVRSMAVSFFSSQHSR